MAKEKQTLAWSALDISKAPESTKAFKALIDARDAFEAAVLKVLAAKGAIPEGTEPIFAYRHWNPAVAFAPKASATTSKAIKL